MNELKRYRVTLVVAYLGWVDYNFGHSSVCLVLLWQMGIWQNRLINRARWWNIKNQSQPNHGNPTTRVTLYTFLGLAANATEIVQGVTHLLSLVGAVELEEDVAAVDVGLDVVRPHGDGLLVQRVSLF